MTRSTFVFHSGEAGLLADQSLIKLTDPLPFDNANGAKRLSGPAASANILFGENNGLSLCCLWPAPNMYKHRRKIRDHQLSPPHPDNLVSSFDLAQGSKHRLRYHDRAGTVGTHLRNHGWCGHESWRG